jgi:cytochrome c
MRRTLFIAALPLILTGCGTNAPEPAASEAPAEAIAAAPANAAPAAFAQCRTCHQIEPGKHGVGPSLAGVFGRKAGLAPGFAYSDAMKNSGLSWDEASLERYLEHPMQVVPGTRMVFAGYADAAKRAEVIGYLKTLK